MNGDFFSAMVFATVAHSGLSLGTHTLTSRRVANSNHLMDRYELSCDHLMGGTLEALRVASVEPISLTADTTALVAPLVASVELLSCRSH